MFYGIRVNSALARLGVRPAAIPGVERRKLHAAAQAAGATPQEAAIIIAAEMPMIERCKVSTVQIKDWILQKKIDSSRPEVREAVYILASGE